MKMPEIIISEPQFELTVNGERWKRIESFDSFGSDDLVYIIYVTKESETEVRFGDGVHGRRLPTGGETIKMLYRVGTGVEGAVDNGLAISLTWTSRSPRENEVIGMVIEPKVDGIIFKTCREREVSHRWKWVAIFRRNIKSWALRLICRSS